MEARRGDEEEKEDEDDNTGDPAAAIVNMVDSWLKSMVVNDSSVELVVRGWRWWWMYTSGRLWWLKTGGGEWMKTSGG